MNKPASLRMALTSAVAHLKHNPDHLHIFIDEGRIAATSAGESLSFEYAYTLNVIVTDFPSHIDVMMAPTLEWLKVNQPEMLLNRDRMKEGVTFEADILNHKTADISLKLKLTERVIVRAGSSAGQRIIEHADEPAMPFERWALYRNGEKLD